MHGLLLLQKLSYFLSQSVCEKNGKKNWEIFFFFDENLQHSLNGVRAKDEKFETLQLNLVEII
jgi:hypothetical protein